MSTPPKLNLVQSSSDCSAYYFLGLPIGLLLAFHNSIHMGLGGLWLGLAISLVYCAVINVWICLRVDWDREAVVVAKRVREAKEAALMMTIGDEETEEGNERVYRVYE
jgi:multidrug resistance protein, MATE family